MNKEKLLTLFSDILAEDDIIKIGGIIEKNYKPHQFTISNKHIKDADENNKGILSEEICQKYKCGHKGCKLKYEDHTCDMELVLQLKKDITQIEAHDQLFKLKPDLLMHDVNHIAFAESEENFKFV